MIHSLKVNRTSFCILTEEILTGPPSILHDHKHSTTEGLKNVILSPLTWSCFTTILFLQRLAFLASLHVVCMSVLWTLLWSRFGLVKQLWTGPNPIITMLCYYFVQSLGWRFSYYSNWSMSRIKMVTDYILIRCDNNMYDKICMRVSKGSRQKKNCIFWDIGLIRETTYPPSLIRT